MKVLYIPYQPHCFAFGGFEIQMLSTFDAIKATGVEMNKIDVWSRNNDFDIVHCWGHGFANHDIFRWAKKSGKKVIATTLMNYFETMPERARFYVSSAIYTERFNKQAVNILDAIVVLNDKQAEACIKYYGIDRSKVFVIPNIVNERFFRTGPRVAAPEKYWLCTGNICVRKNQLLLAKTFEQHKTRLVLIGNVLNGEETYGNELKAFMTTSQYVTWVPGLTEHSETLMEYYQNAFAFVLASLSEQQPISLLEAAAIGLPLMTADKAYGRQTYYQNACLINPLSPESIIAGIDRVNAAPEQFVPPATVLEACREDRVAAAYKQLYESLL